MTSSVIDPDRYTIVPVPIKIIKVLVEELSSASGNTRASDLAAAAELAADDANSDDADWEDEPGTLDLNLGSTKQELMAYAEGTGSFSTRQRDDETQAYLTEFFREVSSKNVGGFAEVYAALNEEEQQKLGVMG